jgi:hypothetical protein
MAQDGQEIVSASALRKRMKRAAEKAKKSDEIMRAKIAYDKKIADKAIVAQVRSNFHLFSFKYTAKIGTFLPQLYMSSNYS